MSNCKKCGKELTRNDIWRTHKIINRGSTEFLCIDCIAEKFDCTKELLEEKIKQFKAAGCTLFK